jgi:hypothetical protein
VAYTDDLIAYWSFEEANGTAFAAHGSNDLTEASGTINGGTGKVGTGRDFEADNSRSLTHANNSDFQTGDIAFTFAFWIKTETNAAAVARAIIAKRGGSNEEYFIGQDPTAQKVQFTVSGAPGYASRTILNSTTALSTGTWHFVVCWHDPVADTINIRVDNGTPDSTAHSAGVYIGTDAVFLGNAIFAHHLDAVLDELGFWKRVLSSDEQTDLFNADSGRDYAYISGADPLSRMRRPVAMNGGFARMGGGLV